MTEEQKLEQLEKWLKEHNASKCGDKVYDGMGVITLIDRGTIDYEIRISPLYSTHNLGNGYGAVLNILF